jgi:hypothetical protein
MSDDALYDAHVDAWAESGYNNCSRCGNPASHGYWVEIDDECVCIPCLKHDDIEWLWQSLGNTPVDDNGEFTEEPFLHFTAGSEVLDIWHWFEDVLRYAPWRDQGERWLE